MNWISVEERLPERVEAVLVYADGPRHNEGVYLSRYCGVEEGWWVYGFPTVAPHVTHWMPLPDPPAVGD